MSSSPKFSRYTDIPFPPYRFIPGENPHPTEDPRGYAYGKPENVIWHGPNEWSRNPQYLYGVDLYNHGYWWESHEAWESLWKKPQANFLIKKFLQGLIKISSAFIKWHLHQQRGLEHLYNEGVSHLKDVLQEQEIYMGLDLAEHIAKVSKHFTSVVAVVEHWPDPAEDYPYIILKKGSS